MPLGLSDNEVCISDETFFDVLRQDVEFEKKPRRLTQQELNNLTHSSNIGLTKEQKLLRSLADYHIARKKLD